MEHTSKRGRKAKVPLHVQRDVYVKFADVFREGIPPTSHNVYKHISALLDYKMSVKSIILSLSRNSEYFFGKSGESTSSQLIDYEQCIDDISKRSKVDLSLDDSLQINDKSPSIIIDDDSGEFICNEGYYCLEEIKDKNVITLNFEIDVKTWKEMEPKLYYYRRNDERASQSVYNVRRRFQRNRWTNILQEQLWKKTKSVCTWCFKYNMATDNYTTKCKGYCNQCRADITVTTYQESENFIGVFCRITNVDKTYKHSPNVKNQVRGHKRTMLSERLKNQSAIAARYTMAADIMDENDVEPSILPKLSTLRQIKHETVRSTHLDPNPILSLISMASTPPYDNCVKNVSGNPFYVYYWTNEQTTYYKECQKAANYVRLSIDATGSIFCKKLRPVVNEYTKLAEKMSGPIFLYVAMTDTVIHSSVPVAQMISQTHSLDSVALWLQTWLGNKKPPNEVVTDDSAALIGAVVRIFNGTVSTNKYLEDCFALLENTISGKTPNCYIRLDTSHFIRTLYKQEIFSHVDYRVKLFYIKCFKLIKERTNYAEVKQLIENIIVIANSKYRGSINERPTLCEISLRTIRNYSETPMILFKKSRRKSLLVIKNLIYLMKMTR